MKDYYKLLQVQPTATAQQIRKAYYQLAQQYHPDKSSDPRHHHLFLEIKEAYEILGDKDQRDIYHYRWQQFKKPAPRATATTVKSPPSTGRAYPPPPVARHFQNYTQRSYREYEPVMRQVCLVAMGIAFLILADLLFAYRVPGQTLKAVEMFNESNRRGESVTIFTEDCQFRMNFLTLKEENLEIGQPLTVWKTPFYRQATKIEVQGRKIGVNQGSVYHNFLWIVLLQLGCALAGLYRKNSWPSRMNLGILAGIFTALTLLILLIGF